MPTSFSVKPLEPTPIQHHTPCPVDGQKSQPLSLFGPMEAGYQSPIEPVCVVASYGFSVGLIRPPHNGFELSGSDGQIKPGSTVCHAALLKLAYMGNWRFLNDWN